MEGARGGAFKVASLAAWTALAALAALAVLVAAASPAAFAYASTAMGSNTGTFFKADWGNSPNLGV